MKKTISNVQLLLLTCLLISTPIHLHSQEVIINEFASSNFTILADEDGDYEDWIEIYNPGNESVNLGGYGLSDKSDNIGRWVFPDWIISPGEYLLIWASGKDRRPVQGERKNGILREVYRNISGNSIDDLINSPNYPDNPDYREIITTHFEAPTNIADNYGQRMQGYLLAPQSGNYTFWIASDDNGHLLLSTDENPDNAVRIAEVPDWTNPREWHKYTQQKSDPVYLEAGKYYYISALMKERFGGDNLAVRWQLPDNTMEEPIPASRIFWEEFELHTNFKIDSSGEILILSDTDGNIIDLVDPVKVSTDLSYGRFPDAGNEWVFFYQPSPGSHNPDKIFTGRCEKPVFSLKGGAYSQSVSVTILSPTPGSTVYYTFDGAEPTEQSTPYTGAIEISKTTSLRARAFSEELQPGEISTATYLINENITFPVVSVTTDPFNLYDRYYGIFVHSNPYWESNLFQIWERPGYIELFETDGQTGFSMDIGIRVHGGLTRGVRFKSLAIMARSGYGQNRINYKIFEDKDIDAFKHIVLRNSGNDYKWTMFRDCMMHSIIRGRMDHLKLSSTRPSVVFLNGEYWGIRNIREKINSMYVVGNAGIEDSDNINFLNYEHHSSEVLVTRGSADSYNELIDFINNHDLAEKEHYDYVASQIDITNYTQYNVAQIYFDNSDWPGNNVKWWRDDSPNAKWRWLLFDLDFGFGLTPFGNETGDDLLKYKHNTLQLATAENGPSWPNPPHSTFLLRNLLKNQTFRNGLINTLCDHLNTSFLPERVDSIITAYQELYQVEIIRHNAAAPESAGNWHSYIDVLREFGEKRPAYLYKHLREHFNLQQTKTLTLNVSDSEAGSIRINSIVCPWYPWEGKYYPDVPVKLTAKPAPGYKFVSWSDGSQSIAREINVNLVTELTAVFEKTEFTNLNLMYFWVFDGSMPNNTPLETIDATYHALNPGYISYHSALAGYPFEPEHPSWRKASMERRNRPTDINYRPQGNDGMAAEDADIRGLQVKQPFTGDGGENTMIFHLPSNGYEKVVFRFAALWEGAAEALLIDYSVDNEGTGWTTSGLAKTTLELTGSFTLYEIDFSDIETADNNPDFKIRIRFEGPDMVSDDGERVTFNNFSLDGVPLEGISLPPVIASPLSLKKAIEDGKPLTIDLNEVFEDPQEITLSFSATSSRPESAEVQLDNNMLEINPVKRGDARITVRANNGVNPDVDHTFRVLVYPAAFNLGQQNFQFSYWDENHPELTYPGNILFLQSAQDDPGLPENLLHPYHIAHDDYHEDDQGSTGFPYNNTRRTRINGLGEDGISFINTGRGRDLGGALIAINTSDQENILVHWLGGTMMENSRVYAIRLQYRVGIEGSFSDLLHNGEVVEYITGADNHIKQFDSIPLPGELLDKEYIQLLWKYYHISGDSGPRAQLRLDDIIIGNLIETGIPEARLTHIMVYPNPAGDNLFINAGDAEITEFMIYDIMGRMVYHDNNRFTGTKEIDTQILESGVYILRLSVTGHQSTHKIIIQ